MKSFSRESKRKHLTVKSWGGLSSSLFSPHPADPCKTSTTFLEPSAVVPSHTTCLSLKTYSLQGPSDHRLHKIFRKCSNIMHLEPSHGGCLHTSTNLNNISSYCPKPPSWYQYTSWYHCKSLHLNQWMAMQPGYIGGLLNKNSCILYNPTPTILSVLMLSSYLWSLRGLAASNCKPKPTILLKLGDL